MMRASLGRAHRPSARTRRLVGLAVPLAVASAYAGSSCVIAEPGSTVPKPAPTRPHVVRSMVVPSAGAVLGAFPEKLVVPVELSDPTLAFQYAGFLDYDPVTREGLTSACGVNTFETASLAGTPRVQEIIIPPPPDLDRCHVIEVVVALQIFCDRDSTSAHSPPDPGGDSVTWFYSPTGDLAGCPVLDAGLDASRNDDGGQGQPP